MEAVFTISPGCKTPAGLPLYLTVDAHQNLVVTTDQAAAHLWRRLPLLDSKGQYRACIVNIKTNMCLHAASQKAPVTLAPTPEKPDGRSLWNFSKQAIQWAGDTHLSLTVSSSAPPDGTAVRLSKGRTLCPQQCWTWAPQYVSPPDSLRVLTYNTHLFRDSLEADALQALAKIAKTLKIKLRKIEYRDDERAKAIVARIFACDPDVICLQEVWGASVRNRMSSSLSIAYPYMYVTPPGHVTDNDVSDIAGEFISAIGKVPPLVASLIKTAVKVFRGKMKLTDGLIVASKYPLHDCCHEAYQRISDRQDRLGRKGYSTFSIDLPISRGRMAQLHIGTTHAPTSPPEACTCLLTAAQRIFGTRAADGLFVGDFNVHYYRGDEPKALQQGMAQYGAVDIIAQCLPNRDASYTDWPYANKLTEGLGEKPAVDKGKERIDYVYFSPAMDRRVAALTLQPPPRVWIPRDWQIPDKNLGCLDLSDHCPVIVEIPFIHNPPG